MTPAQEAKEYASTHGFVISTVASIRKLRVYHADHNGIATGEHVAEVSGYPAALNAMKRYVELRKYDAPVKADGISDVDDGEQPAIMPDETLAIVSVDMNKSIEIHMQDWQHQRDATPRPGHYVAAPRKPFAVSINGQPLVDRYATRTEAIREVRRLLSSPGEHGRWCRAQRISVECL